MKSSHNATTRSLTCIWSQATHVLSAINVSAFRKTQYVFYFNQYIIKTQTQILYFQPFKTQYLRIQKNAESQWASKINEKRNLSERKTKCYHRCKLGRRSIIATVGAVITHLGRYGDSEDRIPKQLSNCASQITPIESFWQQK